MSIDSAQVEAFRIQLQKLGSDYVCISPLPCLFASVSFLGPFRQKTVLWHMNLTTLLHLRSSDTNEISSSVAGLFSRPFIEIIEEGNEGVMQLKIGLDLEVIDEPVIKKTIIMIRNYKRLALGRIEFGSLSP